MKTKRTPITQKQQRSAIEIITAVEHSVGSPESMAQASIQQQFAMETYQDYTGLRQDVDDTSDFIKGGFGLPGAGDDFKGGSSGQVLFLDQPNAVREGYPAAELRYISGDHLKGTEEYIAGINEMLGGKVFDDAISCLVKFFLPDDTKDAEKYLQALAYLKVFLNIYINGLTVDLSDLTKMYSNLVNNFAMYCVKQAIGLVHKAVDKVLGPVEDFVNDRRTKDWTLKCGPFDEMISQLVMPAIHHFRDKIDNLLMDLYRMVSIRNTSVTAKMQVRYNVDRARKMLAVLEMIERAIEHGEMTEGMEVEDIEPVLKAKASKWGPTEQAMKYTSS